MEEEIPLEHQTREKQETILIQQYKKGLQLLTTDKSINGVRLLEGLLNEQILNEQEFVQIKYGIYYSLGNYFATSQQIYNEEAIQTLNKALFYLNECQQIKEDWLTYRTMGKLARLLGFFPKALNLYQKAYSLYINNGSLQLSTNQTQKLPIIYLICETSYLVGDEEQFNHFSQQMISSNYKTQDIQNIKDLFKNENENSQLNQEKLQAKEKLALNPIYKHENIFQVQQNQMFINLYFENSLDFLKTVKKLLKSFVIGSKKKKVLQDDNNGLCSTLIKIRTKTSTNNKSVKKVVKKKIQKERKQDDPQDKDQFQKIQFQNLDEIIFYKQNFKNLLYQITERFYKNSENVQNVFLVSENNAKQKNQASEVNLKQNDENLLPHPEAFLQAIEAESQFYTLIHLCNVIFQTYTKNIFFNHESKEIYGPICLKSGKTREYISQIFLWYSQISNYENLDPFMLLTLLEITYDTFRYLKHNINSKTVAKINQLRDVIDQIKIILLYKVDRDAVKNSSHDNAVFHYLVRYYHIMTLIHSEHEFFNRELAIHCSQQLQKILKIEKIYFVTWMSDIKIDSNQIEQFIENRCRLISMTQNKQIDLDFINQNIDQLIEQYELSGNVTNNDNTKLSFLHILDQLSLNKKNIQAHNFIYCILRIFKIYLNNLDKETNIDQLKKSFKILEQNLQIEAFIQILYEIIPEVQDMEKCKSHLELIELICLKIAIIKLLIETEDQLQLLRLLYFSFTRSNKNIPHINILVSLINLQSQSDDINLRKFFSKELYNESLHLLIQEFQNSHQLFQNNFEENIKNFSSNQELHYFILEKIDFSEEQGKNYRLQQNVLDEIQRDIKEYSSSLESLQDFSLQTNDFYNIIEQKKGIDIFGRLMVNNQEQSFTFCKKKYKISQQAKKILQTHSIEINLDSLNVQDEIKNYVRIKMMEQGNLHFSELLAVSKILIEKVIIKESSLQQNCLEFLSLTLPNIYKSTIPEHIATFCKKQIENSIQNYIPQNFQVLNEYLNHPLSEDDDQKIEQIINCAATNHYYINLYFMVSRVYSQIHEKQSHEISFKYIIYCICESPKNIFYLQHLYNSYYDLVIDYFTNQAIVSLEGNKADQYHEYFFKQKKIYRYIEAVCSKENIFLQTLQEKVFILNLFKYFERKWRYYDKFNSIQEDEQIRFNKLYEIIKHLKPLQKKAIPQTLSQFSKESLRIRILHEIVVGRKIVTLDHQKLANHINNLYLLQQLCQGITDQDQEILQDKEYSNYLQIEIYVSVYKIIRRFIKVIIMQIKSKLSKEQSYTLYQLQQFILFLQQRDETLFHQNDQLEFSTYKLIYESVDSIKQQSVFCNILQKKISKINHDHQLDETLFVYSMYKVDQLIAQLLNLMIKYYKQQCKRSKYHRINIQAGYTISHIYHKFFGNKDLAFQYIAEICQPQTSEIVQIYKVYNKQSLEKDTLFEQFFHHDIFFLFFKFKVLNLYCLILESKNNTDQILNLLKRLFKLYIVPFQDQIFVNRCLGYTIQNLQYSLLQNLNNTMNDENISVEQQEINLQIIKLLYINLRKNRSGQLYLEKYPILEKQQRETIIKFYEHSNKSKLQGSSQQDVFNLALSYLDQETKKKQKKIQIPI